MERGFLIDTHVWLWWRSAPERLGRRTLAVMEDAASPLWLSVASVWEIAIKAAIGKLRLPAPWERHVPEALLEDGIQALPVELPHVLALEALPLHHRDPFDRILVAQARTERLTLVTADPSFLPYEVPLLRASS